MQSSIVESWANNTARQAKLHDSLGTVRRLEGDYLCVKLRNGGDHDGRAMVGLRNIEGRPGCKDKSEEVRSGNGE